MSKTKAFLLSCLIYILSILIIILLLKLLLPNKEIIKYGNSDINILFIQDDFDTKEELKQDYTKEVAKKVNENIANTSNENSTKEIKEEKQEQKNENLNSDLNDLFSDLNVSKSKNKKEEKKQETKLNNEQLEALKKLQNQLSNTTIKSNNNSNNSKTSAKVAGIYDEYFGRVNAYLKNVWSLVTANSSGINDKEFFEVAFTISKDGIIKLYDNGFAESSVLRQYARVFIKTINQQNKNLGIPPNQQDYSGNLRLSVVLSIKEIK